MADLIEYFKLNNGYARMKDIKASSFQTSQVKKLLEQGIIEKIKAGLYKLSEIDTNINESFIDVSISVPKGVICLISALDYYSLTTFNPSEIYLAVPNSFKPPSIIYPPVKFFYFVDRFYNIGIEEIKTKQGIIKIYNKEKTICDMFRYRYKLGEDLAIEALKKYLRTKNFNIHELLKYAELCRIKSIIIPYIKALV